MHWLVSCPRSADADNGLSLLSRTMARIRHPCQRDASERSRTCQQAATRATRADRRKPRWYRTHGYGTHRCTGVQVSTRRKEPAALKRIALIALGVLLFLAISGALARFLSVENVERDDAAALLQAQVRGEVDAMLDKLSGCRASRSCVAIVRSNASTLRRAGEPKILSLKSSTSYSLTGASGKTRLAWTVIGRRPVVQCLEVRRTGNALTGIHIRLLALSAPIPNAADC
jgi:hypothetical protein